MILLKGECMKQFWSENLSKALERKQKGYKKPTDWSVLYLIVLKYNLFIQVRGRSSIEVALDLIRNQKYFEKLNKEEKDFVKNIAN
jgi:hypothetical protein